MKRPFSFVFLVLGLALSSAVFAEMPFTVKLEYTKEDGTSSVQEVTVKTPERGPSFHEVRPEGAPVTASIISQVTVQDQQALIMIQIKMKGRLVNQVIFPLSPSIPLALSFSGYDTKGSYLLIVNN